MLTILLILAVLIPVSFLCPGITGAIALGWSAFSQTGEVCWGDTSILLSAVQLDVAVAALVAAFWAGWLAVRSLRSADEQLRSLVAENHRRSQEVVLFDDFKDPVLRSHLRKEIRDLQCEEPNIPPLGFTAAEIGRLLVIDIHNKPVKSLEGIEMLTSLETLDCSGTLVESIDVSGMRSLKSLLAAGCTRLTIVTCFGCSSLAAVDFEGSPVQELDCSNTGLDLSYLGCDETLEVLACENISIVSSSGYGVEKLSAIDLSDCPKLARLDCSYNSISNLTVAENPCLRVLDLRGNPIDAIDLTANKKLKKVYLSVPDYCSEEEFAQRIELSECCHGAAVFS